MVAFSAGSILPRVECSHCPVPTFSSLCSRPPFCFWSGGRNLPDHNIFSVLHLVRPLVFFTAFILLLAIWFFWKCIFCFSPHYRAYSIVEDLYFSVCGILNPEYNSSTMSTPQIHIEGIRKDDCEYPYRKESSLWLFGGYNLCNRFSDYMCSHKPSACHSQHKRLAPKSSLISVIWIPCLGSAACV